MRLGIHFLKIFIIDVDTLLVIAIAPSYAWVLNFKIIFFLGLISLVAITSSVFHLWKWVWYIAFFPFIIIFWKIPVSIANTGSFNIIFSVGFFGINLFRSIKTVCIFAFLSMLCMAVCLTSTETYALYPSVLVLVALLVYLLVGRFVAVIRVSKFFEGLRGVIAEMQNQAIIKIDSASGFTELSLVPADDIGRKMISSVESAVLTNRLLLFSAKHLRRYQNSGVHAIEGAVTTIFLFATAIAFFSCIYFALFNIDNNNFNFVDKPTAFTFFALSFKAMIFNGLDYFIPKSIAAQALNIFQNAVSIFILTIFGSIMIASRSQRQGYQLDQTIAAAERESSKIEKLLQDKFKVNSVEAAVEELGRIKSSSIAMLTYLTRQLSN